jgi:hypothetical protein
MHHTSRLHVSSCPAESLRHHAYGWPSFVCFVGLSQLADVHDMDVCDAMSSSVHCMHTCGLSLSTLRCGNRRRVTVVSVGVAYCYTVLREGR